MRIEEFARYLYSAIKNLDKRHLLFREQVKKDMILLHPGEWKKETERFQVKKIQLFILVLAAGVLLSVLLFISEGTDTVLKKGAVIDRPKEGKVTYTLEADMGEEKQELAVEVGERIWTKEEVEECFEAFLEKMEKELLADNKSKEHVTEPLRFMTKVQGYPFTVAWECDDYSLIQSDGKPVYENIPEDGIWTTVYAKITYDGMERSHPVTVCLTPKVLSPLEKQEEVLRQHLALSDDASKYDETLPLPIMVDGTEITWKETREYTFLYVLLAGIGIAICLFFIKDKDLHDEIAGRERELVDAYPGFLSKLTVYLVAGMPVRSAFKKMAMDMGRQKSFLALEMKIAVREMESGIPELEAYRRFGNRCQNSRYMKFATLLTQNVKAGSSGLKQLLKQEARLALEEQKNDARKKGEELSSKLLVPMMMQLFIVMVMIMIPVFLSF